MSMMVYRKDRQPARAPLMDRLLRRKQAVPGAPPGMDAGWVRLNQRGRGGLPRRLRSFMEAYGTYDDGVAWVYSCTAAVQEHMASYPFDILDASDEVVPVDNVPPELLDLLDEPNEWMTYYDMLEFATMDLELAGNSYWLKDQMNGLGQPLALYRLRPEFMKIAANDAGRLAGYVYEVQGIKVPYRPEEILHLKYPNPLDELYGMGRVEALQRELGADLAASQHVVGFFSSGARISGVLSIDGTLGDETFDRLEEQFREEYGAVAANEHKVLIAEQGVRFDPITMPPAGTGVTEIRNMQKDIVLSAWGVPAPMLGGNMENANYKMTDARYIFTMRMRPRARKVSERFTLGLVGLWGLQYAIQVEDNAPPQERAESAKSSFGLGASLNELRDMQGLTLIDDDRADEPLLLSTVQIWGQALSPPRPQPQPGQGPQTPGGGPGGQQPGGEQGGAPAEGAPPEGAPAEGAPPPPEGQSYVRIPVKAPRPRQRRRPLGYRKRYRATLATDGRNGAGGRALPPSRSPLIPPPLPPGYEDMGDIHLREADPGLAARILAHRAEYLHWYFTPTYRRFTDYFIAQRGRVLDRLMQYSGLAAEVDAGRRKAKRDLQSQSLWDEPVERDALLAAYLPLVDEAGARAVTVTTLISTEVSWDLQAPHIAAARAQLGALITRVNDTTRDAIAREVELGMARGYSINQIANGFDAEGYRGVMGVFDEATTMRAERIARSETAMIYNAAANAGYEEAGVTHVEVMDGTGDDVCAAAAGSVWTLAYANANPIGHPNCVRAFAPIVTA